MADAACEKKDCMIAETGICLEAHKNLSDCPHYHSVGSERPVSVSAPLQVTYAATQTPPWKRQFHSGIELGTIDASEIMRARYTYLIGIVGSTNVGKTCFLNSLYLLASLGALIPDFLFAGSLTLQGFEERVRLLRKWQKGILPDKLAEHTHLSDPRSPAFMHLALQLQNDQERILDLLLTDLPGEWFADLINHVDTARRFDFLRRADGIIFMIDGPLLTSAKSRHVELHRTKLLLDRLSHNIQVNRDIPFGMLVSKCDLIETESLHGVDQIKDYAIQLGFKPFVIFSASISTKPDKIKSGTGVLETLKSITNGNQLTPSASPSIVKNSNADRSFARFHLF